MLNWGLLIDERALASVLPNEYCHFARPVKEALTEFLEGLPEEYQAAVENAAKAANLGTMANYDVLNSEALEQVKAVAEIREFPDDVLTAFKTDFEAVLDAEAQSNPRFGEILGPWREFRDAVQEWHSLAESSMLRAFAL